MNQEEEQYVNQLQNAVQQEQSRSSQLSASANSMFVGNQDQNLIEWQLELDNILERIDHLLRGNILKFDDAGNIKWEKPEDKRLIIFNDYGVQEILRILSMYLNRNTILSNYKDEVIEWKVFDFANRLVDLIFRKYEDIFYVPERPELEDMLFDQAKVSDWDIDALINDEFKLEFKIEEIRSDILKEKIKLYEMIIGQLVDVVHSAYLRAYNGGERESLRTARMVTQNDPMSVSGVPGNMMQNQKSFSFIKPTTWFN